MLLDITEALEVLLYLGLLVRAALLELLQLAGLGILQAFPAGAADPQDEVLEYAHRADDGAVDAAEDEGEQQDTRDHGEIEGQGRGEELEFGHPSPPVLADAQQQQGDPHEEDGCQGNADFS